MTPQAHSQQLSNLIILSILHLKLKRVSSKLFTMIRVKEQALSASFLGLIPKMLQFTLHLSYVSYFLH